MSVVEEEGTDRARQDVVELENPVKQEELMELEEVVMTALKKEEEQQLHQLT